MWPTINLIMAVINEATISHYVNHNSLFIFVRCAKKCLTVDFHNHSIYSSQLTRLIYAFIRLIHSAHNPKGKKKIDEMQL